MKTMKIKLLIVCFVVSGIVALTAAPAEAVTVLWQSANTDIYLGEPYGSLEFENPLAGTEMIKEYAVIEWLDADYDAGPPKWYDDWSVNDPIGIDGYANEIWMRWGGHSIWTSTTVPSTTVSIHLHGDNNDGLVDVLVDGILVARLDMGTPFPAVDNALIIVKDLAHITHHIRVNDLGVGPNTGGTDVATMGAAALEKRIKWSQPPKPAEPDNLYYGWNEISIYDSNQIVADDWPCDNDDPVTDIHWWGSFKGWNDAEYPPDGQIPTSFHITIWNDIPANPAEPNSFSHPNEVVWEIDCFNFRKKFVGWDYDPRTNCFEACFYYEQDLTEAEYFYQHTNPDGTPNIYWISIAAQYPAGAITNNQWGWKTRRRFFNDDAVKIRKPTMPHIGDKYQDGKPIYWPDETQSWDMAFELTSRKIEEYAKWSQPPKYNPQGGTCYYGWDELSQFASTRQIVADDWVCSTQDPVKDVHWWGSYIGWNDENPPPDAPDRFHIGVWTDVPVGPIDNFSHPGQMIHEWVVPRSELFETYVGCDEHPLITTGQESCFYYEFKIPESQWFYQEFDPAGNPTIYWLSISAIYVNDPIYSWGWKTRLRDIDSQAPDDAVRIFDPTAPALGMGYVSGQPIWWPDESVSWDTAFELTSTRFVNEYTKWSQPPESYDPVAFDGWNELSVYTWNQIVADDWRCDTDNPVTDVHWWGSFLGWSCEDNPPQIPDSFHIAIWTDVPAGVDEPFSHPGTVIWETVCNNFTSKFVGWDIDPRDPCAPPEACFKFEQDLPEDEWFYQKSGGNIYWISIAAQYTTGTTPMHPWGWKTRLRDLNSRAPDDAVRIFNPTDPVLGSIFMFGEPIWLLTPSNSWDMAFELTTKEIPPKKPVPHLKWSQPPIEVDPNRKIPEYSGWDEKSYIDQIDTTRDPLVADDYRCLGSMPVTSIHWWGSHYGLVEPGATPPVLPIGWKIGFWTNVPVGPVVDFSYPEKMLWEIKVPEDRVEVEEVGTDFYHNYHPNDITYQYTLHLNPDEFFWQGNYLQDTIDDIFWISIAAIYSPDNPDIPYPWGWKTRPWHWMDDAVRFTHDEPIAPGIVLDPINITPIKDPIYFESFDVAFELDTDPNYIKWEQPFIGIRRWPHYEDVKSMAIEIPPQSVSKYLQPPDFPEGIDVDATDDGTAASTQILADDFPCRTTGPIRDIHIWGSWFNDEPPNGDPCQVIFKLSIHDNIPADPLDPDSYSQPGNLRKTWIFNPGEFKVERASTNLQGYFNPCINTWDPTNHFGAYKYSFDIDPLDTFVQEGSSTNEVIYWLDVQAEPLIPTQQARFGWKTSNVHYEDVAVFGIGKEPFAGPWRRLFHPETGNKLDMAFEITTKTDPGIEIQSLVADDWKCKEKTPVTDAVWWGSYIGYQYKPCHGQIMPLPVKPDYFLLTIWNDVPAGADPLVPFSHPEGPNSIWKYKAYDYDEVLVGYDKHPEATPGTASGREPVFRYSVRIPKDNWFMQEDVNNIYWFSVVAVYKEGTDPLYDWGWTNHQHVFNDDAVAGFFDVGVGDWVWNELYDQIGNSQDMSFMLFTDPECLIGGNAGPLEYSDWVTWGKPDCWCYRRQCRGDIDGVKTGPFWVAIPDLNIFRNCFNVFDPALPPGCICADLDHLKTGPFRIAIPDLNIFRAYFNKIEVLVPICDQPPIYTGPYNFWTEP